MDQLDLKLQREYAKKRAKAEKVALANLSRARKIPAFVKLEKIEKEIMFELAKLKVSNPKDENIKELSRLLKEVREQRAKILKKIGMTEHDLKPKYSCDKCFDTGFINGKMCDCYRARKNTEMVKLIGISKNGQFDFNQINVEEIQDPVQRDKVKKLKKFLEEWVDKYPNVKKKNITICGQTGLGKTFFARCLAGELLKRERNVCFLTAFTVSQMILKYHTTFDERKNSYLAPLLNSEILIIDDLGTEPELNNVTTNYLSLIISERERMGKPIIITTNLMPNQLIDRYNERIYSRLASKQTGQMFHLDGKDLRLAPQKER